MLTADHPSAPVEPRSRKDTKPKIEVIRAAIATDAEFCPRYNQRAALVSACIAYPDGAVDHFLHPDLRPLDLALEDNERAWYFRLGESSRPLDTAVERALNIAKPGKNWRVTRHPVFGYPDPIPLRLHLIIRFFFSPLDVRALLGEAMFETFLRAGKFEQRRRFKVKAYSFSSDSTGQPVLLQSLTYPYLAFDDAGRACKIGLELEDLFGIAPPKFGLEKTLKAYGVSADYMEHKDAWNHLKTRPDLYWKEAPHIMREYVRGDTMSLHSLSDAAFEAENRLREGLHLPTLSRQQMAHTNGAINAHLIEDWLLSRHADVKAALKHLDIRNARDNTVIERGLAQAGTRHFANANDTSWFLAAVQGGRCHNERPDEYRIRRAVLPDLKSCYSSIMSRMSYPLGLPTVLGWKINEPLPLTLEKFLAKWEPELVDDAWMAVVSTRPGFSFSFRFDLIMSKLSVYQEATSDDTDAANEHADDCFIAGDTCILYKQIIHGVVTSEVLNTLRRIASPSEWREIRENLMIVAAAFYKRSDQCDTIAEWTEKVLADTGTIKMRAGGQVHRGAEDTRTRAWVAVPIGRDLITPLIERRREVADARRKEKDKEELAKLVAQEEKYKLATNLCYGCMVSRHFVFANTIFSNIVTAKARVGIWKAAKALNGRQTITDSALFGSDRK